MDRRTFDFIQVPSRPPKPRTRGMTLVADAYFSTLGPCGARDLMKLAGDWIDVMKLASTTTRYMSREFVKEKVAIYKEYGCDVFVGGIATEIALAQRAMVPFLEEVRYLGLSAVEVSDSAIHLTTDEKVDLVRWLRKQGFKVVAESGKKAADTPVSVSATIREIERLLKAGAYKVIVESDEVEHALSEHDATATANLVEVVSTVGVENVAVECIIGASYKMAREFFAWAIENFGPEVNIGNVAPDHVTLLEMMRHGTYWRGWYRFVDTSFATEQAAADPE